MRLVFSPWVMTNLLLLTSPLFYLYIIIGLALFSEEFYSQFWEGKGRTRFKGPDKFSLQTRVSRTQEQQASVLCSRPLIAVWLLPVADKDVARPQISWQSTERAASSLWAPHSQTTLVLVYMRIHYEQEDSNLEEMVLSKLFSIVVLQVLDSFQKGISSNFRSVIPALAGKTIKIVERGRQAFYYVHSDHSDGQYVNLFLLSFCNFQHQIFLSTANCV